jgi:hypothetical protein
MKKMLLEADLAAIVDYINLHPGYVTWNNIEEATPRILEGGRKFSRVSLSNNDTIANAWSAKKSRVRAGTDAVCGKLPNRKDREAELRLHVRVLRSENDALCDQLARWAFNAERKGITQAELEKLPPPSRPSRNDGEKRLRKTEEKLRARITQRRENRASMEAASAARRSKTP